MEVPEAYAGSRWFTWLQRAGWTISGIMPCADVARQVQRSSPPPAGVRVRPAGPADHGFVIDCLLESTHLGLSDYERLSTDAALVRANASSEFRSALEDARAFSYVAERDGRLVAHATAEWSDNAVLGTREALLHDILVRDGFDGQGVGSALELEVLRACHRRGVPLLRGTLSFEHVSDERLRAVSARIEERGWWFSSRMLYKPLGVVDGTDPVDPGGQQEDD
jgi:GNAT superfamily N-acetyltransferase